MRIDWIDPISLKRMDPLRLHHEAPESVNMTNRSSVPNTSSIQESHGKVTSKEHRKYRYIGAAHPKRLEYFEIVRIIE